MYCPFCQQKDSRVLESRVSEENKTMRRRRECESCKRRFTTYERVETIQVLVVKNSGSREAYSREKLMAGIVTACRKTSVSAEQIEEILDAIELEFQILGKREIASQHLGELVLARLKILNEVAYVRFASVYRQFQSIENFIEELRALSNERILLPGEAAQLPLAQDISSISFKPVS